MAVSIKCFVRRPFAGVKYALAKNGRCPKGTEITSQSDCSAAAQYLKLSDTSAQYDGQKNGVSYDPPFCYFELGALKFNGGRNTGSCTQIDQCLCASAGVYCA